MREDKYRLKDLGRPGFIEKFFLCGVELYESFEKGKPRYSTLRGSLHTDKPELTR